MSLTIEQPGCDCCPLCRSLVEKAGFIVQDDQGVRKHLCYSHLTTLLRLMLEPVKSSWSDA